MERMLRNLTWLLSISAAVMLLAATLAMDPILILLERWFSPDGSLKESTKILVELRLYGFAALSILLAVFASACRDPGFRNRCRSLIIYDPMKPDTFSPASIFRALSAIVLSLVLISLLGQYLKYVLGYPDAKLTLLIYSYFNLDQEHWVPTTISSMILLYAAALLAQIAWRKASQNDRFGTHWWLLSAAFIYLAIDEKFRLHERIFDSLQPVLDLNVPVFWVVPAGVILCFCLLAYLRFIIHLPLATRLLFVFCGTIYVGGAIGFEIVGQMYAIEYGANNFSYEMMANAEELFEMMGIVGFIYALQTYLWGMVSSAVVIPTAQSPIAAKAGGQIR